jgi:Bacterial Ig-like domain
MDPASVTKATFKLFKCPPTTSNRCTNRVTNVAVSLGADGLTATLNPFGSSTARLSQNTKYRAVVTTGAEDLAGNALDQDAASGNQQKALYLTTGAA